MKDVERYIVNGVPRATTDVVARSTELLKLIASMQDDQIVALFMAVLTNVAMRLHDDPRNVSSEMKAESVKRILRLVGEQI